MVADVPPVKLFTLDASAVQQLTYDQWWNLKSHGVAESPKFPWSLWSADGRLFIASDLIIDEAIRGTPLTTALESLGLWKDGQQEEFRYWRLNLADFASFRTSLTEESQLKQFEKDTLITPFSANLLPLRQAGIPVTSVDFRHSDAGISLFLSLIHLLRHHHLNKPEELGEVLKSLAAFLPPSLCTAPWFHSLAAFFLRHRCLQGNELALFVSGFHAAFTHLMRLCDVSPSPTEVAPAKVFEHSRPLLWILMVGLRKMYDQCFPPGAAAVVIPLFADGDTTPTSPFLAHQHQKRFADHWLNPGGWPKAQREPPSFPSLEYASDQCRRVDWLRVHPPMNCILLKAPLLLQIPGGWGVFVSRSKADRKICVMNPLKGEDQDFDVDALAAQNATSSSLVASSTSTSLDAYLQQDSRPPKEMVILAVDVSESMKSAMGRENPTSPSLTPQKRKTTDTTPKKKALSPPRFKSNATLRAVWEQLTIHWIEQKPASLQAETPLAAPDNLIQKLIDLQCYFARDLPDSVRQTHFQNLLRVMLHYTFPDWSARAICRWATSSGLVQSLAHHIDNLIGARNPATSSEKPCLPEPRILGSSQSAEPPPLHECPRCLVIRVAVGPVLLDIQCPAQWSLQQLYAWLRTQLPSRLSSPAEWQRYETRPVFWFHQSAEESDGTPAPSFFPADCTLSLHTIRCLYRSPESPSPLHFRLASGSEHGTRTATHLVMGSYVLVGREGRMLMNKALVHMPLRPEDTVCTLLVRHFHQLAPLPRNSRSKDKRSRKHGGKGAQLPALEYRPKKVDDEWTIHNLFAADCAIHQLIGKLFPVPTVEEWDDGLLFKSQGGPCSDLHTPHRTQTRLLYCRPREFTPIRRAPVVVPDHRTSEDGPKMTRLQMAHLLFQWMVDRATAYDYPHRYAVIKFNQKAEVVSPLQPCIEVVRNALATLKPDGRTSLYDALALGLDLLRDGRKQHPGVPGRLIILTDAEENCSSITNHHALKLRLAGMAANENGPVTVDLVLLQSDEVLDDVTAHSGIRKPIKWPGISNPPGCIFAPRTPLDCNRLGESEIFLSLENRCSSLDAKRSPLEIVIPTTVDELRHRVLAESERLKNSFFRPRLVNPFTPQRIMRLRREIIDLVDQPHSHCRVVHPRLSAQIMDCDDEDSSTSDHFGINTIRIVIQGPEGTPYHHHKRGFFTLMMLIDDTWPDTAPRCVFLTPILHLNVSTQGRVCHSVLDRNWDPSFTLRRVLECNYGLLLSPEPSDPIDSQLALQLTTEPEVYRKRVEAAVRQHGICCPYDLFFC